MSQVYTRSGHLEDRVHDVKLRIPEWKVLFAVDGVMDSAGMADLLDIPEDEINGTLSKLKEMQLVTSEGAEEPGPKEEKPAEETTEALDRDFEDLDFGTEESETEAEGEKDEEEVVEGRIELSSEEPQKEEETISLEEEQPSAEEPAGSEEKKNEEEENLSDQEFDKFIGGLLSEEESEAAGETEQQTEQPSEEVEQPSQEADMPLELPNEEEDTEIDFGDIFKEEESSVAELEVEEETETPAAEEGIEGGEIATEEKIEEEAKPEAAPAAGLGGAQKTILVVDDSVVIRKMVEIALENEQYNIMSVATGKDALNYIDEHTPDLIILDIMLPDINGLDVLKAVKASKQIPIVMLSAKDTPRETSKAKELGADDFIPKPFKDEELVSKIKELVND